MPPWAAQVAKGRDLFKDTILVVQGEEGVQYLKFLVRGPVAGVFGPESCGAFPGGRAACAGACGLGVH
eukprot:3422735-Lingulodinium_polyedra.AAC.1